MTQKLGIPWTTNRVEGCECPCDTCIDTIGYDPEIECPNCPIDHEQDAK